MVKYLCRLSEFAGARFGQGGDLLISYGLVKVPVDGPTIGKICSLVYPLPDLSARNLRGGGVFHQVVDSRCSNAVEPGVQVLQGDADVCGQAGQGNLSSLDT